MRYPGGDVEGDGDVGGGGLPGETDGVVEEDLVRSGLDDQGRQARQVGEYRADQAQGGVVPGGVVGDPGPQASPVRAWRPMNRAATSSNWSTARSSASTAIPKARSSSPSSA